MTDRVQTDFASKEEAITYFRAHKFSVPSNSPNGAKNFQIVQLYVREMMNSRIAVDYVLFRFPNAVGHDGGLVYSEKHMVDVSDRSVFLEGRQKRELWWSFPSLFSVIGEASRKDGECPNCGERGIFIRTALICPKDKTLIGGF